MEEFKDEQTVKFLKYWEQRFKTIIDQNTNWTKMFMTIDPSSLPIQVSIDKFCSKYSQEFQLNISYKIDENSNQYDLTITK